MSEQDAAREKERRAKWRKAEKILFIIACAGAGLFLISSWLESVETGFFQYFYTFFRVMDYVCIAIFVPATLASMTIFFIRYFRDKKNGRQDG